MSGTALIMSIQVEVIFLIIDNLLCLQRASTIPNGKENNRLVVVKKTVKVIRDKLKKQRKTGDINSSNVLRLKKMMKLLNLYLKVIQESKKYEQSSKKTKSFYR